jgi:hypothetical protein
VNAKQSKKQVIRITVEIFQIGLSKDSLPF